MKKSEIQQKRNEILKKIDALQSKCNCFSAEESSNCSNCKRIANYGDKLMKLVNKRKFIETNSNKKSGPKPIITMTKAEYLDLKKDKKLDREIAEMYKVSPCTIRNWKKKNGIITPNNLRRRKVIS